MIKLQTEGNLSLSQGCSWVYLLALAGYIINIIFFNPSIFEIKVYLAPIAIVIINYNQSYIVADQGPQGD